MEMAGDPSVYAEMAQIDVTIVRPFLQGTEQYSQAKVTDEVFALKQFVDELGADEVRKVVVQLADEGKHEEILPKLKSHSEESAKAKKSGLLGWLFKGKDKSSSKGGEKEKEKEKEHEKKKEKEKEKEKEKKARSRSLGQHRRSSSQAPSSADAGSRENASRSEQQADNFSAPPPAQKAHRSSGAAAVSSSGHPPATHQEPPRQQPIPSRGLPFNPQLTREEMGMTNEYNFQSESSRAYTVNGEQASHPNARKDDDFDAIFKQFLSGP